MSNAPFNSKMNPPASEPPRPVVAPQGDDEATDFTPAHPTEDGTDFTPAASDDGATDFSLPTAGDDATDFKPPVESDNATDFSPTAPLARSPASAPRRVVPQASSKFKVDTVSSLLPAGTSSSSSGIPPNSHRRRFVPGELVARGVYRILHEIETAGREAIAYQGESVIDQTPVFIKQLVEARSTVQDRQKLAELRDRLISINNDFCLKCHELFLGDQVLEVFEYLPGAVELRELLRNSPEEVQSSLDQIIWQLARGVAYLHSKEIVHRDLKPSNIMVQYHKDEGLHIKIVDYGTISLVGDDGDHTTFAGSRHYSPPEALKRKFQSRTQDLKKYDWWSVGRIIQEILTGCTIGEMIGKGLSVRSGQRFSGTDVHFEEIMLEEKMEHYQCRAGMVELTEAYLTEETLGKYRTLLRGLLTTHVETRWGFPEIIQWFQNQDPPEYYETDIETHSALHFQYQGRSYTLGEIAQTLATHEHWANAQKFLFQGLNATRNEKTLLDFIRLDIGDKHLIRDLDEITSLPNPRKLPNRELLPALEDYATGLALARIAQSGGTEMGLYVRGVPVNLPTITRWSQSTDIDDQYRAAVIVYPPLIEFFSRFALPFYNEIIDHLRDFDEVRKMELAIDRTPLTAAQTAQIFGLLLSPPEQLLPLVAGVREKFRLSTIRTISPLLEASSQVTASLTVTTFLIFSATKDPKRFLTHEHFYSRERTGITLDANALVHNYVWLNAANILRYRTTLLCSLWYLIPGHTALLFVYCVGLGIALKANPDVLMIPFGILCVSYIICLASIRAQIWSSLKGYVKNNIDGGWILSSARYGEIIDKVSVGPNGKRLTRKDITDRNEELRSRLKSLPFLQKNPINLPNLPQLHGVSALFALLVFLMLYSTFAPIAMIFGANLPEYIDISSIGTVIETILPTALAFVPLGFAIISWVLAVVTGVYFYSKWKPIKI